MDPKKKFWLFKQSKHFCSVPWNHFEIFSTGSIKTCAKGDTFGNINNEPLENILNNTAIQKIRSDLYNDQPNINCNSCYQLTTRDEHFDLRNHYNPMFKNFNIDYSDFNQFALNGIDLHWDNTCNFKCVYCNPAQSSLIAAEQGLPNVRLEAKNIDKIIELIIQNQHHMKEIYFSGGEPLLIKHNARLLSRIDNIDLPLRINSNISLTQKSNPVFNEITRFRNVLWTISADTCGEKFNYIRNGGNWNTFLQNLDVIKQLNHQVRLNLVWFIASAIDLTDTIEFFVKQYGITDITINQLEYPPHLRVRNAPDLVKQHARDKLIRLLDSGLIEKNSNAWYNIARCTVELDLPTEDPMGYKNYFDGLDQLRDTNWRSIFPELV
jgi:organic radical activating enzyme